MAAVNKLKRKLSQESDVGGKKAPGIWHQGLKTSMTDPELLEFEDDTLCVIKDRYPKVRRV